MYLFQEMSALRYLVNNPGVTTMQMKVQNTYTRVCTLVSSTKDLPFAYDI